MATPFGTDYARSLPYLLSAVGAVMAQRFADVTETLGLSPRAFGALSNLSVAEGQTQQQLADGLGLHRNKMVALVDEMEAKGWMVRTPHPDDRRAVALRLTGAGRALVAQVNSHVPELELELTGALSRREHEQLTAILRHLADDLQLRPSVHPRIPSAPHD